MAIQTINSLRFGDNIHPLALPYGVCSTAADTAAKTVTVNNFSLETGAMVVVKFTNANSIKNPTLNVNNTGAKAIMRYGTTTASTGTTTTGWVAGAVQMFVYDGTNWIRDYWNNTTYSNLTLGQGYAVCDTAAATVAKTVALSDYALTNGGIVTIKFTHDVPANATLNINSKGAKDIYYRGTNITADVIKATDVVTFIYNGTQYILLSIDRWQKDISVLQNKFDSIVYHGETNEGEGTLPPEISLSDLMPKAGGKFTGAVEYTTLAGGNITSSGIITANQVYGAVWNDYAEFRQATEDVEPGHVVCENGNDTVSLSTKRMQPGAMMVSDTYGFAIGETDKCKCPIAVAGRVLMYPCEKHEKYKPGDAVCSGPNGTVSKMSRLETILFPDRILGTVSSIPNYEFWGEKNIEVKNRIWIKVI